MAILIDERTKVIVQGITGTEGRRHALSCRDYGTLVVGGVSPDKSGTSIDGIPIYSSVERAQCATGADATLIFVPPAAAADAILEALDAGMGLIVCVTEGVPALDMVKVKRVLQDYPASLLLGPNCPGLISPGRAKAGIMPGDIHRPGRIGIVSRSGTLMYEAVSQLVSLGFGQSTCVGIGGDPVHGLSFVDILALFEADPDTDAVLLIGEIGGSEEEAAAVFRGAGARKPAAAYIAGGAAPPGRRMGHAGAIVDGSRGSAETKRYALRDAGFVVADDPGAMGEALAAAIGRRPVSAS
jgi:succinyl-CoA synthetase alpha subunit